VEVLLNYTYRVERSGQVSVQSEQRLKPYHVSPDAVGQAPLLLEPNRQPNHRGRTTQPREVEIVVPRETDQEQAALLEQLERQQEQQQQALRPPPLPGENTPTHVMGEGGDPPTVVAEEPLAPPLPVQPERSQSARRPPRYLADYAVGHMELPPRDGSPSSMGDYPILVGNSLHYPGEFHQEEEIPDQISEGTRLRGFSFQNSIEFPTSHITLTLAVMRRSPPAEQSEKNMEPGHLSDY